MSEGNEAEMRVVIRLPLQTMARSFDAAAPAGARCLQLVPPGGVFDEGRLLLLVDPREKRGQMLHFHWVGLYEEIDPQDLEYVGSMGDMTLWVSTQRTPLPEKG